MVALLKASLKDARGLVRISLQSGDDPQPQWRHYVRQSPCR